MSAGHIKPPKQSDRAFGLMFGAVFGLIFGIAFFAFDKRIDGLIAFSGAFFLVSLIAPGLLLPLNRLWGLFAQVLGYINNFFILGLFYYLFLFPVGVIFRLIGRDPMNRKIDRTAPSYWTDVNRTARADNFFDMF